MAIAWPVCTMGTIRKKIAQVITNRAHRPCASNHVLYWDGSQGDLHLAGGAETPVAPSRRQLHCEALSEKARFCATLLVKRSDGHAKITLQFGQLPFNSAKLLLHLSQKLLDLIQLVRHIRDSRRGI